MKKTITIIVLIAAFVAGFLIFFKDRSFSVPPEANTTVASPQKWETKTDDRNSVTVVVTPLDLSPQSAEWKFDIGMNTHSVELDQDLTKIAVLTDDQGKEYQPLRWDGALGGHHREGVLIFNGIQPIPKNIELRIKDIGGSDARTFDWKLTQ